MGDSTSLYLLCLAIQHWRIVIMSAVALILGVGYLLGSL